MHKVIIVTADARTLKWKSLDAKKRAIKNTLNTMKNADFTVDVVHETFLPEVANGRITHSWFKTFAEPYYHQGYDFIIIHMKDTQRKAWGISPTLRGAKLNVASTEKMMAYFWADENTTRVRLNQFIQTCLHEISHAYCDGADVRDLTHEYHVANPDIRGIFASYDMAKYQPVRMGLKKDKTLLERILGLWQQVAEYDRILSSRLRLQPLVQRQADVIVETMAMFGHPVRIVEGFRSNERQDELYAQGRTTPGIVVTNARGGESAHNYGVAVDFVFRNEGYDAPEELWQTLGSIGESAGFEWGGRWKTFPDKPHFEMLLGYSLQDFQAGKVDYSKYQ
ncbi:M15 family metallopeptidase [Seohaeicola saemankumensis]|uniref:M15 family metallopeptidase n=1 Tax=Seohaeicola saemankumensis TaxID=481181 RepID=UPI001E3B05AD|nr:M15 family metallopeptidase [Seohaeicola saemankumensis]MCD1627041.1 M15 family metallopeptidase [Seohaeicola saemankumensis]